MIRSAPDDTDTQRAKRSPVAVDANHGMKKERKPHEQENHYR
jgi:hypothetical protein